MNENTDVHGQAVDPFRRAEVALAAIADDADRLVDARSEVEQARNELKVVAGALVGLATAHRDLVGQLGEAAAALRPAERGDDDRLAVAVRESDAVRARQTAETTDAVEQLAHRDRAVIDRLPGLEQLAAIQNLLAALTSAADTGRLDHLTTSSGLEAMEERLVERLSAAGALSASAAAEWEHERQVAEQAATTAALAVEDQVAQLIEHVHAGQRRVHQLVLAVAVAFLVFAAVISVLALG